MLPLLQLKRLQTSKKMKEFGGVKGILKIVDSIK